MGVILHPHPVRSGSHIQRSGNREVATVLIAFSHLSQRKPFSTESVDLTRATLDINRVDFKKYKNIFGLFLPKF